MRSHFHFSIKPLLIFAAFLLPREAPSEPKHPDKSMKESPTLSCHLRPGRGNLNATVDFEISKVIDPLEFRFTVTNSEPFPFRFLCSVGNITISFRNLVNLPLSTPWALPPMHLMEGEKDPNDDLIEFYEIDKNGKPGKRFREAIISVDPKESKQILVRMGPEMMKQLNGILKVQNEGGSDVKLGVVALFSIRLPEDRTLFRVYTTNPTVFFQYRIPQEKKE